MSDYSSKNPYLGEMIDKKLITHPDSTKETRHICFDLGKSGLKYKVGDALGIIPQNPPELVSDLIGLLNFSGDEVVETHLGEATIEDALTNHYEVHRLSKKFIQGLEEKFSDTGPKVTLRLVGRIRNNAPRGESKLEWNWSGDEEDYPPEGEREGAGGGRGREEGA